jgi:alkaline phosphatase D
MSKDLEQSRRRFLKQSAAAWGLAATGLSGILATRSAPAALADRPVVDQGLQIGDVLGDRAIVWSRTDRPSRLIVEWDTTDSFANARRVAGPHALEVTDFVARVDLTGLPRGQDIFVRALFESVDSGAATSEPLLGHFRSNPLTRRDVCFVWGGDTNGQGWGINPDSGGMKIYESMRRVAPDFFIHSGDNIYADGIILPSVTLPDGTIWRNLTTPEKSKVAETLDEYRGNYRYNLLDDNVRRFNAEVAQIWQWDDHEVVNNWSPGKDLTGDARYTQKSIQALVANAQRAFLEYAPMRWFNQAESERVYRQIPYSAMLEVFVLDMRTYRAANSFNRQTAPGADTVYMGRTQIDWLKAALKNSRATWKVIAADMPLGLVVGDGKDAQGRDRFENSSNGDGPVLGREFEIAEILSFIKREGIDNVVWITADVHYCAAHFYDPAKAVFKDFAPFWEFVAGPLNAGTFGPNPLDNTFGPQVVFQKVPPAGQANLPPSAGLQFFGEVRIDARSGDLTVAFKDIDGNTVFTKQLHARHYDRAEPV